MKDVNDILVEKINCLEITNKEVINELVELRRIIVINSNRPYNKHYEYQYTASTKILLEELLKNNEQRVGNAILGAYNNIANIIALEQEKIRKEIKF